MTLRISRRLAWAACLSAACAVVLVASVVAGAGRHGRHAVELGPAAAQASAPGSMVSITTSWSAPAAGAPAPGPATALSVTNPPARPSATTATRSSSPVTTARIAPAAELR